MPRTGGVQQKTKRAKSPRRVGSKAEVDAPGDHGSRVIAIPRSPSEIPESFFRGIVKREVNKLDWACELLATQRVELVPRDWVITKTVTVGATGEKVEQTSYGALHHKISKDVLQEIGEAALAAYGGLALGQRQSKDQIAQREAVRVFVKACQYVAGPALVEVADANFVKLLWNLAVNLSLGPPNPAEDPGRNFDGDTVEADPRTGARRYDAVSAELLKLQEVWYSGRDRSPVPAGTWAQMAGHLLEALRASGVGPGVLAPPSREQWLHDQGTGQFVRRKLRRFPGAASGTEMFRQARGARGSAQVQADYLASASHPLEVAGEILTVAVELDASAITHVLERHTLAHFTFADRDLGLTNTFWEPGLASATAARDRLAALLPDLARRAGEQIAVDVGSGTIEDFRGNLELREQPAGGGLVYFVAHERTRSDPFAEGPPQVTLRLETVAPDGPGVVAFLRAELLEIGKALGARS